MIPRHRDPNDGLLDWGVGLPDAVKPPAPSSTSGTATGQPVGSAPMPSSSTQLQNPFGSVGSGFNFGSPVGGGGGQSIFNFSQGPGGKSTFQEPNDGGMGEQIRSSLSKTIAGDTTFSPEVMETLKANLRRTTDATQKRTEAAIREQAAELGVSGLRSGQTRNELADAARMAGADYAAGVQNIEVQKAMKDFEDRMGAIDRAEKWLTDLRSYALGKDQNQIRRDELMANIGLAFARMSEDREQLKYDQWKFMMNREPIEGRDYTWAVGDDGQKHRYWYRDIDYTDALLGR